MDLMRHRLSWSAHNGKIEIKISVNGEQGRKG